MMRAFYYLPEAIDFAVSLPVFCFVAVWWWIIGTANDVMCAPSQNHGDKWSALLSAILYDDRTKT